MARVLILRAPGINRDADAAAAVELAGGQPERVHVNRLAEGGVQLRDYAMLIVPGGFSYGDHMGAGKLLAVDLIHRLGEQLADFVADGRPVLGICNGFQVLVKAGILPGRTENQEPSLPRRSTSSRAAQTRGTENEVRVTLTDNSSNRFECRWVQLAANPTSPCIFTRGIERPIEVPVAHGEGRLVIGDAETESRLQQAGHVALRYVAADGSLAAYPANPNGSHGQIAGLCNAQGNVLGLMPHPENAVLPQQHPRWTRQPWRTEGDGLAIFRNAVGYAQSL
ncbi:MAG: phosphoribosylformylglycinamidine synthase I [Chloroflexaceae bacterium]|jgi:phosphoribosylformylglycinamidine synthase|nr:phosphoribosylformylglycinamidine synthase I [Chloroflexaceae bacterium]